MGTPNSGDCYPFQRPRVSVSALQPRTDQDIRAVSDRYPAPKAKTPEELETSFVQIFKDYTKAARKKEDSAPEIADCEQKLIKVIRQFRKMIFEGGGAVATIAGCNSKLINWLGQMGIVPVVVNALSSLTSPDEEKTEEEKEQEEEEDLPWTLTSGEQSAFCQCWRSQVKGCASDKFVNDALELDIAIFPPSMDMIHGSTMHFKAEIEERLISLIESLTGGIAETEKHILSKRFEENDGERITWLMEHFIRYSKKVDAAANHLKKKQLNSSELYKEKLQYGFPTLQSIAVILGYLWSSEISAKIESELSHHQIEKKVVWDILSEYRDNIGSAGGSVESTKTVIEEYIASLEVENRDQRMKSCT
ncbi:hypothetical protein C5167_035392 [Papaver somniferum]|uniref:Beta-catenin-like protein 1 N-terminal domain-containing protein n=1 Tax=Papaver somniferum TaxID=3469 RepID=A0A4Y7KFS4_PAPSO|nr:hypothetical protein C5167_035392 [Papaver somniferum]